MRRFNPEKELKKLQHGNRNRIIFCVIALLIILGISSSYALYQVKFNKRIIFTRVSLSNNYDLTIDAYIDGVKQASFPTNVGSQYEFSNLDCETKNVTTAKWDYDQDELVVQSTKPNNCKANFTKIEQPNPPELYQGLIPVKYSDSGEVIVADPEGTDWYDYNDKRWANAVLVDNTKIAADLSGNGNNGNFVGGAQITADGLVLDGNDDGIYLGNVLKDLFKHSNTVQIKLKRTDNDFCVVMGNYNTPSAYMINYEYNTPGTLRVWWNSGKKEVITQEKARTNEFFTLTYVYDSAKEKLTIYQDNEVFYESNDNDFSVATSDYSNAYIGRDTVTGTRSLTGIIEKVMVYDSMLSEEQINQNLKAESGKVGNGGIIEENLHLYYDFKVPQKIVTKPGETLNMDTILQMYVWIPRYKYQLFNVNNEGVNPQEIKILFENGTDSTGDVTCEIDETGKETCENAENGNWYTHPAFTFGDTELPGIWVGKFETSHTTKSLSNASTDSNAELNCSDNNCNEADNIRILPNKITLRYNNMLKFFYVTRSIERANNIYNLNSREIDTHLMKNMEWGVMAYLTQSKYGRCDGKGTCTEVTYNSNSNNITGYASQAWQTANGQLASSTGNMYGIYDMNGGSWEYVMGVTTDATGVEINYSSSTFNSETMPDPKYYDLYEYGTDNFDHKRGHLGDATRETLKTFGDYNRGGWYDDTSTFPSGQSSWFPRSGNYSSSWGQGIFTFHYNTGMGNYIISFRIVLTAQDGEK